MIYSRLRLLSLFLERRKRTSGGERPNLKQRVAQAQPASPLASRRLCLIAFLPVNFRVKEKLFATSKMFTSNLPQINLYTDTAPSSLVCSCYWARATVVIILHYTEFACMDSIPPEVEKLFPTGCHTFSSSGFPANLEIIFLFISTSSTC